MLPAVFWLIFYVIAVVKCVPTLKVENELMDDVDGWLDDSNDELGWLDDLSFDPIEDTSSSSSSPKTLRGNQKYAGNAADDLLALFDGKDGEVSGYHSPAEEPIDDNSNGPPNAVKSGKIVYKNPASAGQKRKQPEVPLNPKTPNVGSEEQRQIIDDYLASYGTRRNRIRNRSVINDSMSKETDRIFTGSLSKERNELKSARDPGHKLEIIQQICGTYSPRSGNLDRLSTADKSFLYLHAKPITRCLQNHFGGDRERFLKEYGHCLGVMAFYRSRCTGRGSCCKSRYEDASQEKANPN